MLLFFINVLKKLSAFMLPTASSSFINFELNTETYDAELS